MNSYGLIFIPLIVTAIIVILSFLIFNLKLYFSLGFRPLIVTCLFLTTYGGLSYALSNEKIIVYFFATIITLIAAIAPRCYSLVESYRQYQYIIANPKIITYRMSFIRRTLDILPDLVVILLIFSLASDAQQELRLNTLCITLFYIASIIYILIVAAYIAITDKINLKLHQ